MKKSFRILKFKKDNPIFEVKDISKSFDGRPILKKLSLKVCADNKVSLSEYSKAAEAAKITGRDETEAVMAASRK